MDQWWIAGNWIYNPPTPSLTGYWQLYTVTRDASAYSTTGSVTAFYKSGAELARVYNYAGVTGLTLGGGCDGYDRSDGDIAEILVYNSSLPDVQRVAIEAYLAARYSPLGYSANLPVSPSASLSPSNLPTPATSFGITGTPSPTASASANRCATDESFAAGAVPSTWSASPVGLVSVVTSAPPRGVNGVIVTDPLNPGSPFAYLTSGTTTGSYTTLSFPITMAAFTTATVGFDVLFDAGDELPYDADAAVTLIPVNAAPTTICGAAFYDGANAVLTCPPSSLISSIQFASYGNSQMGGCATGEFVYGSCHANSSVSVVAATCMGQQSCSVLMSGSAFAATACSVPVSLHIMASCSPFFPPWYARDVAAVGAYAQSGWQHVDQTITAPGVYALTFGVRAAGRGTSSTASALAVDNVLVCFSPAPPTATASPSPSPLAVAPVLPCPTLVCAGSYHTCAITRFNNVLCWGSSQYGQATVPSSIVFANVTSVTCGGSHTCVIIAGGAVACWGLNTNGQTNVPSTLAVVGQGASASFITAGRSTTCAILFPRGETVCWGESCCAAVFACEFVIVNRSDTLFSIPTCR